jgi:hypothetical protein
MKLRAQYFWICAALVLLSFTMSCQTTPSMSAINLSEPGWTLRQGQAVWLTKHDAPEIAGEVLFASHLDGRSMLQFTKTPLPFVTVQTTCASWQVEFAGGQRRFAGARSPSMRLLWVHLARALNGTGLPSSLEFSQHEHGFALTNKTNGESITGFFAP